MSGWLLPHDPSRARKTAVMASTPMSEPAEAIVFHLAGSDWRFRLGAYLRSLRRRRALAMLLLVAAFPVALDRAVDLMMPGNGMFLAFLAIGVGAAAALAVLGALLAIVGGAPASTVVFTPERIHERIGRRTIDHGWDWVLDVVEDDRHLVLHCHEQMRTFRLARTNAARLLLIERHHPDAERLKALLATRRVAASR